MKSVPVCCWLVQPLSQEAQVTPYHGPAFRTRSQRAAAEVGVCAGGAASGRLSFIIATVEVWLQENVSPTLDRLQGLVQQLNKTPGAGGLGDRSFILLESL
ncbi:hexosaminidase D isoform X2 [Huso huso]|uniref:Hexosaminidase D isoform X2 n=1 Tax=Huso huso TaxID=61971 RepID=A0ABR0Z0N9_HUSHU